MCCWAGGYDKDHALLAWRHSIVFQAAAAAGGVRAPVEEVSSVCRADEVDEGQGPLRSNAAVVSEKPTGESTQVSTDCV